MAVRALAEFLRDRRTRLHPADVGLADGATRRRTPGLRREEVAERSRMSTEYYTQLEQARAARPSPEMLDALAAALRLSSAEHAHLYSLAGASTRPERQMPTEPPQSLLVLLDRMVDTAVIVTDVKHEVIAWNALAVLLIEDFAQTPPAWRNMARRLFLHPERHQQHFGMSRTKRFARYIAADLRIAAARYPNDVALAALVDELRTKSTRFERLWQTVDVQITQHIVKKMLHPTAGELRLHCNVLIVPENEQRVVLFTATPRTRTARVIRAMAASIHPSLRGTRMLSAAASAPRPSSDLPRPRA